MVSSSSLLRSRGSAASYSLLLRSIPAGVFGLPNSITGGKFGTRMMTSTISSPLESPPYLMLPPTFEGGNMFYNLYRLADNKIVRRDGGKEEEFSDDVKFVGSSHGWLASFNQRNNDLFLSNPLSGRRIKLPPIDTLPDPKVNLRHGGRGSVSKVIISCSPDEDEEECRAMMSFGPNNRLAFCWPGRSTQWSPIGTPYRHSVDGKKYPIPYEDFIYCTRRKLFFCTTKIDYLECWDLRDPPSPRMHWMDRMPELYTCEDEESEIRPTKYLVSAEGQLFLVRRSIMTRMGPDGSYVKKTYFGRNRGWDKGYPYKTIGFDAYKIEPRDEEGGGKIRLRLVEGSLDGLAMFIGINHSFAIRAARFPELKLKPDSIYFTDDKEFTPLKWVARMYNYGGHDVGIFDFESKSLSPCYYSCDYQSIEMAMPAPLWFTPTRL